MSIEAMGMQLEEAIRSGLSENYERISSSLLNEELYAYVLYMPSGFYSACIAASTRQSLERVRSRLEQSEKSVLKSLEGHPDLLEKWTPLSATYSEVSACEWEYIYNDIKAFDELDSLVSAIYEYSYEEAEECFDVSAFLSTHIFNGIRDFKQSQLLQSDLLLGLQFADPSESEREITREISLYINSQYWHEKVNTVINS